MRFSRLLLTLLGTLWISACELSDTVEKTDWRDREIYVQVGDVVYSLEPGRAYGLGALEDDEVNAAIANDRGTKALPLPVRSFRAGVYSTQPRRLQYDVTVVDEEARMSAQKTAILPSAPSEVVSILFKEDVDRLSDSPIENTVVLEFRDGQSLEVFLSCHTQHLEGARRTTSCSNMHLSYKGNFVSINTRSGDADAILRDFRNGLKLIAQMERN